MDNVLEAQKTLFHCRNEGDFQDLVKKGFHKVTTKETVYLDYGEKIVRINEEVRHFLVFGKLNWDGFKA